MSNEQVGVVYAAIAEVQSALAHGGISKDRKNQQQGYSFRGIDDVYNELAPTLAKHGLVILPRVLSRAITEREAKSGGLLFNVVVEAEFDLVAAADGSRHTVRTFGEAMDSADKATSKAMSAAYKYMAFMTFCIPTEGDNDADAHTPEVKPRAPIKTPPPASLPRGESPKGKAPTREQIRAAIAEREGRLDPAIATAAYAETIGNDKTLDECSDEALRKYSLMLKSKIEAGAAKAA